MRFDSFIEMLKYQANVRPEAPALKDHAKVLTFSMLYDAVLERKDALKASGKTCLAVLSESTIPCVVEIFAANAAGLQVVLLDPSLEDEVLAALLHRTDADLLYADEELQDLFAEDLTGNVADGSDRILFFTSGTTDSSKAVVLTGKSLCASAWNGSQMLPLQADDTLLCILPLSHVFGFVCGLLWSLSCGACTVLGSGPRGIFTDFSRFRPTAVSVVPMLLAYMLKAQVINPELKTILIGAGDCPGELIEKAKSTGILVSFGYGLTETSSGIAISTGGDPYALSVCPDDRITIAEDGEVLIEAPTCIMQGYYKDPSGTEAVLKDGVLKSGDLGYLDAEGKLHLTGRKKEMLVLSDGTKIFLPEYEGKITKVLGHNELAVDLINGRPVLILESEEPKEALLQKLQPLMETIPRGQQLSDLIIIHEPLPRTATGKIKRWELRQKVGIE